MSTQIKAIVFDCFGVLTTDGWLPFAEKYFGSNSALLQQARDLNKQVDAGFLSYPEFIHSVAELAGVAPTEAFKQIENNVANVALFDYISELKVHYKIGMLSNAGQNWLKDLFTPQQVALFSATVFSFELGVVKPDPHMYTTVCERLGVLPEESIFIDDIERYATGAKEVGMKALVYKNIEQLKTDLKALL